MVKGMVTKYLVIKDVIHNIKFYITLNKRCFSAEQ